MITEERVLDFIRSFGVDRGSEALHMIEKEAIRDDAVSYTHLRAHET